MIWLLVKISISYFAWKALNKNPTSYLPQISRTGGDALMTKCPPYPGTAQHRVGGNSISCSSPVLTHFWGVVGRGAGKKLLSVGYLLLIAFIGLNHHQGPELLCMEEWRNVAIFPFIYWPSRFFLSMKVQEVFGNGLCAFSTLEVCNMDMYLIVIIYLFRKQKINFPFGKMGL